MATRSRFGLLVLAPALVLLPCLPARAQSPPPAATEPDATIETEPVPPGDSRGTLPEPEPGAQPLTLGQALRRAVAQSEYFDRTRYQDDSAHAQRDIQCSLLWPRLVATGQIRRNDAAVSFGDRTVVNLIDPSGHIQLNADLFAAGNIPRCRAAGISADSAHMSRVALERGRLFDVAQAYIAVLASQLQVQTAETALELRRSQLEATQARREAELALQSDVSRASLEASRAELDLLDARTALDDAMDALALLLGDPQGTRYALSSPEAPALEEVDETPAQAAARLALEAAQLSHRAPYWDLIPTLGLVGVTNFGRASFSDPNGINWSISLVLTWTLFDGGTRYGQMHLTDAEIGLAEVDQIELDRALAFDTAGAERRLEAATDGLELAIQSEELARQTYENISILYERGLTTGLDQTTALSDWISAQNAVIIARLEQALATLEVGFSSGRLWPEGVDSL